MIGQVLIEGIVACFIVLIACVILLMEGLFDRLFIDWFWVGKTKAWIIPGTEDLMPYIYGKSLIIKWATTLIGYPVCAAILAAIMNLILK